MHHLLWPYRAVRVLHCTEGTSDKLYITRVDQMQIGYRVVGSYGKASDSYLKEHTKAITETKAQAVSIMCMVIDKKLQSGYQEIKHNDALSIPAIAALNKIDTSRIVVIVSPPEPKPPRPPDPPPVKVKKSHRVKRRLIL